MRCLRCLAMDVLATLRSTGMWLTACAFCCVLMLIALRLEVGMALAGADDGMTFDVAFTLGDYLLGYFAGCVPFTGGDDRAFAPPIGWFVFFLLLVVGLARYPRESLCGFGQQVLIACGNRWAWWWAKCVWVAGSVLLFCTTALLVALLFSLIAGSGLSWSVSPDMLYLIDFPWQELKGAPYDALPFMGTVAVVAISLGLFQLCLSFLFDAVAGVGASAGLLVASAFGVGPIGFCSFSMAARCGAFVADGWLLAEALAVCGIIALASMLVGGIEFNRRRCFGSEDSL